MTSKKTADPHPRGPALRGHEAVQDARSFVRAVAEGLASADEGRELTLAEVKGRLREA